jgi:hypothetical protein
MQSMHVSDINESPASIGEAHRGVVAMSLSNVKGFRLGFMIATEKFWSNRENLSAETLMDKGF